MTSFIYQELVEGAVFLLGLWLVARGGELSRHGRGARWLTLLIGGFFLLALLQGAMQWGAR